MAQEMPQERQALPVLKVLYRNTARIGEVGGRRREVLKQVEPVESVTKDRAARLRAAMRKGDMRGAERLFRDAQTLK